MRYEDDIPTKKETESESSRFQKQNEHSRRKNYLLNNISDTQTIITCTGLDEFVRNRFTVNRVFEVIAGHVYERSI